MKTLGIGLLGLGTVGSGVVKALMANRASIEAKLRAKLELKHILVRNLEKQRPVQVTELLTTDVNRILTDPTVAIVVEVMGGIEPAKSYILEAIRQGKHVITANKEIVAKYGQEIISAAEAKGVGFFFEASVGGGIPIIRPLKQCLAANEIDELMGIINGTTNFILSKMAVEGKEFDAILAEAQEYGYAEPDPTNDVDGYDSAYKLAILASLAFGVPVSFADIQFAGIRGISREDVHWAQQLGYTVKLLAAAKEREKGLELRVGPCLLPLDHPLAAVNDVYNGILVKGNLVGQLLFTGKGAGDLPTGSAVVADIIDSAKSILNGYGDRAVCTCYRTKPVLPPAEFCSAYYLRVSLQRVDAALPINNMMAQVECSVAAKKLQPGKGGTIIYLIRETTEKVIGDIAQKLRAVPGITEVSVLRLEDNLTNQAQTAFGK